MAEGDEIQNISINQALYQNAARDLLGNSYGTRIVDGETGQRKDTGVNTAIEEVANLLMSGRLVLNQPLVLRTRVSGQPAIKIIYESLPGRDGLPGEPGDDGVTLPPGPTGAIEITDGVTGEFSQLGIGLQNIGLVANEFVPSPTFFLNPTIVYNEYSTVGIGPGPTAPSGQTGFNPPTPRTGPGGGGGTSPTTGIGFGGIVGPGTPPTGYDPTTGTGGGGGGFPFITGPLGWQFWYQFFGRPQPPGGMITINGYDGDVEVVTDVTWDEETCEMTKTTSTLTFKNGMLTGVS